MDKEQNSMPVGTSKMNTHHRCPWKVNNFTNETFPKLRLTRVKEQHSNEVSFLNLIECI